MTNNSARTLAFQISEEFFQRIKAHLERETQRTGRKLTQREFVLRLIEEALDTAIARAREAGTTVAEALQQIDYNLPEEESHVTANKAVLGPGSKIAEKPSLLMPSSPITAARITIDVDSGIAAVEVNPLWEKRRDERESGLLV